jgi:hypothetical protein
MPQLHYWRYEELPGADSFSHIDPSDHEGREQAWAEVKQNLAEETAEWVPKGRELVALFEHARRSGGVLRRQVFAVAYEGPIDFDTLCDRVLGGRGPILSPLASLLQCQAAWTVAGSLGKFMTVGQGLHC